MFWTVEKLYKRINELNGFRYRGEIRIEEWWMQEDTEQEIGVQRAPVIEGDKVFTRGDQWKGRDKYIWLQKEVVIPSEWKGRKILALLDFGRTSEGNNAGFESLFYLDGVPYQGVDSNHQEVILPPESVGASLQMTLRLWSGLEGGGEPKEQVHEFKRASIAWLDDSTDNLYFTARAALQTSELLTESEPLKQELLKAVDRAFLLIDWSRPGSEMFYESVVKAEDHLCEAITKEKRQSAVTVTCIGHTHIDVAWLWRLCHTREKAARSFSTVLRLMEQYPEYIFLQSMPQLYVYIKQDYPEIYQQIKARVQEGRWEAGGAMWLEADCNLSGGESLVRQILYGTRFFREEFGLECRYLWLPDVFGYSWALPQILKKSGINTFMTTKISWNQYNRMPNDTFIWRGIDGSEVLTHFVTTPEAPGSKNWWYTYNGVVEPYSVKGIWDAYRNKPFNWELLLSYGYGDGGGGVNREMLEMRRRLEEMPGLPKVLTGRADDYFERLHQTVKETDQYVQTWDGELYLEYHRGTYTSQAFVKKMNRKLELLYRDAEIMQVLRSVVHGGFEHYPRQLLLDGWLTILRNQFHDIIPGSSILEVYEDCRKEYSETWEWGSQVLQMAASALSRDESHTYTVYNSSSFARTAVVELRGEPAVGHWLDDAGRGLSASYVDGVWQVLAEDVPPLSCRVLHFEAHVGSELSSTSVFDCTGSSIQTPYYEIEWNSAGKLTRLYDKRSNREVLASGEAGNVLQVFEDKPKQFEAWDIDLFYQEKMRQVDRLESVRIVSCSALKAEVCFQWRYMDSEIEQVLTVYANSARIDFVTRVNWQEKQQLLKVAFPVAVRATEATYDIQFGNVKRPTHWNTSWDYARFETVGHQWADLSERGYGVSLLNDCKYGYDIKDHVMRLTLIKSATFPDPSADVGLHEFTYSLLPHEGDWVQGGVVQEAWGLNQPLQIVSGGSLLRGKTFLKVDKENIIIDTLKKSEDGDRIVVRLHEFTGTRCRVRLCSDYPIYSWQESDLMERPLSDRVEGSEIELSFGPYEIKTILLGMFGT
jgi:alpha-mannosidase